MSDMTQEWNRRQSPLQIAAQRINRRLRRVCSLLEEPSTVDSPPSRLYWLSTLPSWKEAHSRLERFSRMQSAITLADLNAEHDRNSLDFVAGVLCRKDHDDLESMFREGHRRALRKAIVLAVSA